MPVDDSNYGCTECEALNIVKALNNVGRENQRCCDDRNIFHASLTTWGCPYSWLGIRGVVMNDICINLGEEKARRNQCKLYIHFLIALTCTSMCISMLPRCDRLKLKYSLVLSLGPKGSNRFLGMLGKYLAFLFLIPAALSGRQHFK
uniref:Uncharacterized protein n=1 Tax=Micrurus spixii TaxID=129469 RepID=A0A2D4LRW3_9SAUR